MESFVLKRKVRTRFLETNQLFHCRKIMITVKIEIIHLASALMEHFLEGSGLLRLINDSKKCN